MALFCWRGHTATAALVNSSCVRAHVPICVLFQSVCQAVTVALKECWLNPATYAHGTIAVVDEPDLSWKKL